MNIEQILHEIKNNTNASALNTLIKGTPKDVRDAVLASMLPDGRDPLEALDPAQHTLGFLYILAARLNPGPSPTPSLPVLEEFCKRFNPQQARLAPERVSAFARLFVRAVEQAGKPSIALGPLFDLVTRYPPSLSHLTTVHRHFLNLCVATKHFAAALPILQVPIMHIETSLSDINYNDNLQYHYAGGVALAALKMWKEAEEFFEICVCAPGQVPAAIQLEALKKLTLVQLILYGKAIPTPKYTHPVLVRLLKSSPYGTLSRAYPLSVATLSQMVNKDADTYNTDQNVGLARQVVERAPRWLISKLTSTYLTLGLGDIAKEVSGLNEDDIRATILNMVEDGSINASISVDGTVTFSDQHLSVSKAEVDAALMQAQEQSRLLFELERAMHVNKEFLAKAIKHKDDAGWGADEDVSFGLGPGGGHGPGAWAEEAMFA